MQTSLGKNTGCPAAAVPITAPTSLKELAKSYNVGVATISRLAV
jgi:hypothetical protein